MLDMKVGEVRNKVVPHQEAHQDPVINDVLQIILKGQLVLGRNKSKPEGHSNTTMIKLCEIEIYSTCKCILHYHRHALSKR